MDNQDKIVDIKKEVKGRGLFYGVIAVATFIVMAVGATFAYFTATTSSSNTAVTAGSTTLELKYISYETAWNNFDLIPADVNVVQWSFEKQNDTTLHKASEDPNFTLKPDNGNLLCKDDYGNSICSVYVFQVENASASPQTLTLSVVSNLNGFANLHAIAYDLKVSDQKILDEDEEETLLYEKLDPSYEALGEDISYKGNGAGDPMFKASVGGGTGIQVTDGKGQPLYPKSDSNTSGFTPIYVNRTGVEKTLISSVGVDGYAQSVKLIPVDENSDLTADKRTVKVASGFTIESNSTKTFALILFIENQKESDQTSVDAAKSFSGQVIVGPGDSNTGVSGFIGAASEPKDPIEE